jgi:dTDP-4-dehydrorhamnose reductase
VVRTSAFFGPWDKHNFVTLALAALERGQPFMAASDLVMSPTYVPDLVHACLDLAIDRENGIWHLSNGHAVSWAELANKAAERAGVDASRLEALPSSACAFRAQRPRYCALHSERAVLLPSLDNALDRYIELRGKDDPEYQELVMTAESRQPVASGHRQQEESTPEAFHAKHF